MRRIKKKKTPVTKRRRFLSSKMVGYDGCLVSFSRGDGAVVRWCDVCVCMCRSGYGLALPPSTMHIISIAITIHPPLYPSPISVTLPTISPSPPPPSPSPSFPLY